MKGPRIFASRFASFVVISLLLAAVTGATLAGADSPPPDTSRHLLLVPDTPKGEAALARTDARVVARYHSFSLVEAAGSDDELLRRAGADRRDDMRRVTLGGRTVDPAARGSLAAKGSSRPDEELVLVQFVGPVKPAWLSRLRDTGGTVVGYAAQNGYLVHADGSAVGRLAALVGADSAVRAVTPVQPGDKLDDAPKGGDVAVDTVAGDVGRAARTEASSAGPTLQEATTVAGVTTQFLRLGTGEVGRLADDPAVVRVEPYAPPRLLDERVSQIAAGNLSAGVPTGPGYLSWLSSEGFPATTFDFAIDVTDSGLDFGPASSPTHADFYANGVKPGTSRVAYVSDFTGESVTADCLGHGTNVASIAGGYNDQAGSGNGFNDAAGFNYGLGVAPRAQLGSSKIFKCNGQPASPLPNYTNLTSAAYAAGARISNNSWGTPGSYLVLGRYDADARTYDALVRDARPSVPGNQEMVEVFAAGNNGKDAPAGQDEGYASITSPGTAKNVITVGASENVRSIGDTDGCGVPDSGADQANDLIDFSSRGPTDDERLKPDLVAPGTHVIGARPTHGFYTGAGACNPVFPSGTAYNLVSGTSQATPVVSGAAALVRDWYRRGPGGGTAVPSPALTKAVLVNTAADIAGGNDGQGNPIPAGPSDDAGWGRVDLANVLDGTSREYVDQSEVLGASGDSVTHTYDVPDTDRPVKVTLAWTDPPGTPGADAFVNDLDLEVDAGGHTYLGNVFGPAGMSLAGGSADPRNNVESVYLPAHTAGRISVTVRGTTIAGDGVPGNADSTDQDFALVASNAQAQAGPVLVDGATDLDQSGPGDQDGALESGEEVDMTEHVHNAGSGSADGPSAVLHGGSGVTVTQDTSTYPDIAAGDTEANDTPFTLQLANGATCGQDASATLDITTTTPAETQTIPLVLPTGEPGPSQTTSAASPNVPVTIPDDSAAGASSSVFVAQRGRIKDVNLTLGSAGSPGITHTWDGDLVIDLVGPDGTTVRLADHPGGPDNSGDNFAGTVFDDEASQTIGAVGTSAPYTGDFRPQHDQLSRFDGQDRRGTWTLRVRDLFKGDSGSIEGWGLTTQKALCDVDTVAPSTSIDSGPANPVSSSSATFGFTSDDPSATFECRLDSAAYEPCSSPKTYQGVSDGVRTFQVRAIDGSDNEDPNPPVYSWVVDTTPPETTIASGPSGVVGSRDATFGFSSEPGATFECSLDGGAFQACSSPASYGGLGDGGHSLRVRARDTLGNLETTPAAASWTVDTTSPATAILSPSAGSTTQDATPLLRGTAGTAAGDDGVVTVELFKGALAAGLPAQTMIVPRDGSGGSWSVRPRALGEGSYTVRVVQHDSVGHVGTSASTFSVVPPGFVLAPGEVRLADALANRITVLAACASSCQASAKLTVSGRAARRLGLTARSAVALGTGSRRISRAGAAALRLRLSARGRRALRGRATATAVLAVTVTRAGHPVLSAKRAIDLRRSAGLRWVAGHGLRLWAVCEASCPLRGTLTLSAGEARRLGMRAKGSARVTIGSGRSAASSAGAALTLKVRASARKALSRARVAHGLVEVAAGSTSELRRAATLPVTLRR